MVQVCLSYLFPPACSLHGGSLCLEEQCRDGPEASHDPAAIGGENGSELPQDRPIPAVRSWCLHRAPACWHEAEEHPETC